MTSDNYTITQAAYNTVAESYAQNAFAKQWMKGYVAEFCKLFVCEKNPIERHGSSVTLDGFFCPGKLLDLGCGPGNDSTMFVQRGFEVVGVDFSAKMLDKRKGERWINVWGQKP